MAVRAALVVLVVIARPAAAEVCTGEAADLASELL